MKQPGLTTVWILLVASVASIYGIGFDDNNRPPSMIDSNFTSQITKKANEIRSAAELVIGQYSTNGNQSDLIIITGLIAIMNNHDSANITDQFESIVDQLDSIVETVESLRNDSIKYREDEKKLITKLFTKQLIQLQDEVGRLFDLYSEESTIQKSMLTRIDEIKQKVCQFYELYSSRRGSPDIAAQFKVLYNRLEEVKVFLKTSNTSGIGTVYSRRILNVVKIEIDEIDRQLDQLIKRHPIYYY